MSTTDYQFLISTYAGLEKVLEKEILQLGGRTTKIHPRSVSCTGDIGFMYKANFCLRTALNVMVNIKSFRIRNANDLYNGISEINWAQYIKNGQQVSVRCTLNSLLFSSAQLPITKVKEAVDDYFQNAQSAKMNDSMLSEFEITIQINDEQCAVMLNSSGHSLHRRGYRQSNERAGISEVLAAGLVLLTGWEPHLPFVDLIGDAGLISIEAALLAAKIPPGTFREQYAFMTWPNYEEELFNLIRNKQMERIVDNPVRIFANSTNQKTFDKLIENIKTAGVEDMVTVSQDELTKINRPANNGTVIAVIPYSENPNREVQLSSFKNLSFCFKKIFSGYSGWILSSDLNIPSADGLMPEREIKLFSGAADCKFLGYKL